MLGKLDPAFFPRVFGPDGDQLYTTCKPVIYSPGSFVICDGAKNTETLIKWVE